MTATKLGRAAVVLLVALAALGSGCSGRDEVVGEDIDLGTGGRDAGPPGGNPFCA